MMISKVLHQLINWNQPHVGVCWTCNASVVNNFELLALRRCLELEYNLLKPCLRTHLSQRCP